jgi:hypothetical protein
LTRLLPVFLSAGLPSSTGSHGRGAAAIVGLVLLGGKGVSVVAPRGALFCAAGWAIGVVGWVKEIKAGEAEGEHHAILREKAVSGDGTELSEKRALTSSKVSVEEKPGWVLFLSFLLKPC